MSMATPRMVEARHPMHHPGSAVHFSCKERSGTVITDDIGGTQASSGVESSPGVIEDFIYDQHPYAVVLEADGPNKAVDAINHFPGNYQNYTSGVIVVFHTFALHPNAGVCLFDTYDFGRTADTQPCHIFETTAAPSAGNIYLSENYQEHLGFTGNNRGRLGDVNSDLQVELLAGTFDSTKDHTTVFAVRLGESAVPSKEWAVDNPSGGSTRIDSSRSTSDGLIYPDPPIIAAWNLTGVFEMGLGGMIGYVMGTIHFEGDKMPTHEQCLEVAEWHTYHAPRGIKNVCPLWAQWNFY